MVKGAHWSSFAEGERSVKGQALLTHVKIQTNTICYWKVNEFGLLNTLFGFETFNVFKA